MGTSVTGSQSATTVLVLPVTAAARCAPAAQRRRPPDQPRAVPPVPAKPVGGDGEPLRLAGDEQRERFAGQHAGASRVPLDLVLGAEVADRPVRVAGQQASETGGWRARPLARAAEDAAAAPPAAPPAGASSAASRRPTPAAAPRPAPAARPINVPRVVVRFTQLKFHTAARIMPGNHSINARASFTGTS
ncbi:MAG TPA: hypothetical protein VHZ03_47310 [Trebonia sp.]|nr:hypothetical protein [Trebonia sp.]